MYEATFRVDGGGAYAEATTGTDATVELWCNDHCDLLHVRDGDDDLLARVESFVGVQDELVVEDEHVIVTENCLKDHEVDHVETYLERHGCLVLPPLVYVDGGKLVRVLALDAGSISAFFEDLSDAFPVTVESLREIQGIGQDRPLLSLDTALPDLSQRQRDALVAAETAGYYEIPRRVTTATLAESLEVSRRTFEEHLRRAENKLVSALVTNRYV